MIKKIFKKKRKKKYEKEEPVPLFVDTSEAMDLVIFDDIFPHPLSDWRLKEHAFLLANIEKSVVYTGQVMEGERYAPAQDFDVHRDAFELACPDLVGRVKALQSSIPLRARLAYCLFYNNIDPLFGYLEKFDIPFVFTLYPGGGFEPYNPEVRKRLATIFSSPLFRHVIVNMPFVYQFVVEDMGVDQSKVSFIYGAPLTVPLALPDAGSKGETIKVVFCAHRYSHYGLEKGFDVFCKVAKALESEGFEFYVIGNYDQENSPVELKNVQFLGSMMPEAMGEQLSAFDILLSPNRSFVFQGQFDGFPTGTAVHASLAGCMLMVSDGLDNAAEAGLEDGEDLILISDRPSEIVSHLRSLASRRERIREMACSGREKLLAYFDDSYQLGRRMDIMSAAIYGD